MLAFRLPFLFVLALSVASSPAMADSHTARESFRAGVQAFERGDLEQARTLFERARAQGLDSLSLLYNLGVVYYRLESFDEAKRVFSALLDTPHQALARYNLGLVALGRGDNPAAIRWFRLAAEDTSPDKIQALAERQLSRLEPQRETPVRAPKPWVGYLSLAGGYDDNIAGVPDAATSERKGGYAELLAAGSVYLLGHRDAGVRLQGAAYTRQYPSESEFDTNLAQLGVEWLQRAGPGRVGVTVSSSQSWLDSRDLERQYRLELSYRFDQCPLVGEGSRCKMAIAGSAIEGGDGFEAYDGEWYRAQIKGRKQLGRWLLDAEYRFESNHRQDLQTGQEFFSVSPQRQLLTLGALYRLTNDFRLGIEGGYRHSRYRDPHQLVSNSEVITERRVDRRSEGTLVAEYSLSARWLLRAEWTARDNDSSIDRYQYKRQTAQLGIEGAF